MSCNAKQFNLYYHVDNKKSIDYADSTDSISCTAKQYNPYHHVDNKKPQQIPQIFMSCTVKQCNRVDKWADSVIYASILTISRHFEKNIDRN
jgi:hypothetical protein